MELDMQLETVTLEVGAADSPNAGIATITLNRPERKNAINAQMWVDLKAVLRAIVDQDQVRVVVVTGAGGEFCSGADLGAPGGPTDGSRRHQLVSMREVSEVALALHRLPMPTIAKVNGVAVGAGCNMALGCDLVVASDRSRFSEIFAKRGLALDFGGSWILPRLIGLHRAKELAFFADIISAHDAHDLGIVNRVLPEAELDGFVDDWAQRLAAGPPLAYRLTKKLLNEGSLLTMDQALEAEGWTQTVTIGSTADTGEAMRAFLEKRTPKFQGR